MARKRTATNTLNHTNWEQEDEPEEAGNFVKATEDIIQNRVIKVAKRRNPIGTLAVTENEKKNIFANFGGFGKPSTTSPTVPTFGFLSNSPSKSEDHSKTNGTNDPAGNTKTPPVTSTLFKLSESKSAFDAKDAKPKDYYAKLKGLNQSVSKWIQKHVDANPFINLTPIFKDYEKYFEEIEKTQKDEVETQFTPKITETITNTTKTFKTPDDKSKSTTSVFTSTNTISTKLLDAQKSPPTFSFPIGSDNTSTPTSSTFNFGKANVQSSKSGAAGFSFGNTGKPFTFVSVARPVDSEGTKEGKDNDEDEDEPPKVEFTPVVEDGHIYTVRCKVFVKRDGNFCERGVGNLFLKPVSNKDKVQLIVRADTNLGNLLCNFILSDNIPMQRMGKKDVMLVCLPMPDSTPPPVPMLLRVKSTEEADELLQMLEKHKK